jgi:hypothetical protein
MGVKILSSLNEPFRHRGRPGLRVIPPLLLSIAVACHRPAEDGDSGSSTPAPSFGQIEPGDPRARNTARVRFQLERLAGARVRVVWTRDLGDGTDILSSGEQLTLMGLDSGDNRGERPILSEPAGYAKPLITPKGDRVVYSKLSDDSVHVVDWDGTNRRRLASGFGMTVWLDPRDGREWVYVGTEKTGRDPGGYRTLTRYLLDDPEVSEPVWKGEPVSANTLQLSRAGRWAGGLFPWPNAGVADLEAGTWRRLGDGCWTGFASDDSHLFWFFDGSHRNLTLVDVDRERRWRVAINGAPGVGGFEVYHPRWTNQPRFLVVTGPYTVGGAKNKVRGGGRQVEIFLGRFAADFTSVELWEQVTHNDSADFYPDGWIDPSSPAFVTDKSVIGPPAEPPSHAEKSRAGSTRPPRLVVDVEVAEDVTLPTPAAIAPYRQALLAMEYSVIRVVEGSYSEDKLIAAHWVIREGRVLPSAARPRGERHRLVLEPYDGHPELEGQRLVMDTDEFLLTLYYDIRSTAEVR